MNSDLIEKAKKSIQKSRQFPDGFHKKISMERKWITFRNGLNLLALAFVANYVYYCTVLAVGKVG